MAQKILTKTGGYTLHPADDEKIVYADTSAGTFTITAPTPPPGATLLGYRVWLRVRGGNPLTFAAASGQTVEGGASASVASGAVVQYQYDGGDWFKL